MQYIADFFQFIYSKVNVLGLATYQFLQLSCSFHEVYTEHTSTPWYGSDHLFA